MFCLLRLIKINFLVLPGNLFFELQVFLEVLKIRKEDVLDLGLEFKQFLLVYLHCLRDLWFKP